MKTRERQNFKPGDIVLVHFRSRYYARVLSVEQRFYRAQDPEWMRRGAKVGDRYNDLVTFEKIYEKDFSPARRKYVGTYDEAWMTKVDEKMLEKQKEFMLESINNLKKFSSGVV